jgi:ribosomal protein S18 acetylase RimI-like enzyme
MKKAIPEFIKVTDEDSIHMVVSLAIPIWMSYYSPIIGKEAVAYMLRKLQSAAAIRQQIYEENYQYYLIRDAGQKLVGYIAVLLRSDEIYLSKFYVHEQERGRGYGRKAMEFIEILARDNGLQKISLNVNKQNIASIQIYEKLGFTISGAVVIDIGNGYIMDDYKMQKSLS